MPDVLFNIAGVILFLWLIAKLVKNLAEGIGGFLEGIKYGLQGDNEYGGLVDSPDYWEKYNLERAKHIKEEFGKSTIEEILFSDGLQEQEKKYLLGKIHNYNIIETNELFNNYQTQKQKSRLKLAKRKIAQKADELFDTMPQTDKREPIPEDVRMFVWRRDGGKCVKCGSQENLHFDHIIPHSKGGSDTERNLQLLCEKCNLEKSDKI